MSPPLAFNDNKATPVPIDVDLRRRSVDLHNTQKFLGARIQNEVFRSDVSIDAEDMLGPTENRTFGIGDCKKIRIGAFGIHKQRCGSVGCSSKFPDNARIDVN